LNEFLNQILERPKWQKIAILSTVVILLIAVYYSTIHEPRDAEIAKLTANIDVARNDKTMKQQKAANLPKLQVELKQLEIRLKEAIELLPNKKEVAELLRSISTKAQESGLQILIFRPRAENYQDFYAEIPVDITVKGSFQNAVNFFDDVGRLNRLINIDNIGFKNPTIAGDRVTVETTSVATAFRFLDEPERKKIAEQKAKAAKDKK
jgi:type IV pilus assembly protein PilO